MPHHRGSARWQSHPTLGRAVAALIPFLLISSAPIAVASAALRPDVEQSTPSGVAVP